VTEDREAALQSAAVRLDALSERSRLKARLAAATGRGDAALHEELTQLYGHLARLVRGWLDEAEPRRGG
jgi:hypothetical protein